ncbi:hypothetical protein L2E82_40064 [Cichorium intybus]|uniref:Uncharacterized protein n=1 Tax=Cichorium intybus TaxID=13427 RepID=A0ACB9AJZ2_CICIN|nr:hypothetical protein L2E82_40064 [Cichorium intybus]
MIQRIRRCYVSVFVLRLRCCFEFVITVVGVRVFYFDFCFCLYDDDVNGFEILNDFFFFLLLCLNLLQNWLLRSQIIIIIKTIVCITGHWNGPGY